MFWFEYLGSLTGEFGLFAGTLTKRHHRRKSNTSGDDSSNCSTLKRQHSHKSRGSMESMGSCSGNSTPLGNTPVREHAERLPTSDSYTKNSINMAEDMPSMVSRDF